MHQNQTPSNAPYERATFFQPKIKAAVKTQFGANMSGKRSDTAFHRVPAPLFSRPQVRNSPPTEKVQNKFKPASFLTFNRLMSNAVPVPGSASSYGGGVINAGRWGQLKRSASEPV
jgi:hypothetical protein